MLPFHKILINLFILISLLITQNRVVAAQAVPVQQAAVSSISGRVTDGSGNGVEGVTVYAMPDFWHLFLPLVVWQGSNGTSKSSPAFQNAGLPASYSTSTDANGDYSFPALPSGAYSITAEKDGILFTPISRSVFLPNPASQDFQVQILPPVIPPTTKVVSPDTNQYLQSVSPDGSEFTFSQTTQELLSLSIGDFMVSDVTASASDGYLRKVTSVTDQGGNVVVDTEPAVLEEAVEDGSVYLSNTLSPSKVTQSSILPGVNLQSALAATATTFYFEVKDVVLYDDDGNPSTKNDQVKANGSIEFEMDYEFYLNIQDYELRNLTFATNNFLRDTIEIVSEYDLASLKVEKVLASQTFTPLTVMIGPVPVVVVPRLDVVVGVDGSVKVGISTSVSHEISMRAGLEYVNPAGWRPIAELTDQYSFTPPHATLEATFKGYFGARFNLYLYGVAGPYVKATPFLELKIQPLETSWWVLYAGVDVPAGFRVPEEMKQAGKWLIIKLDDYEMTAIGVKQVIAQAQTTNHAPDLPSNPSPTNGAIQVSTNPTLSWIGGDPDGDEVVYDVFLEAGDNSPDVLVSENQSSSSFSPGVLSANTTYFWQINPTDIYDWSNAGPVWSFTTGSSTVNPGEMITIPAGSFRMGCDPAHNGNVSCSSDLLPIHTVYLDEYRIDKYEVTNAQYAQCVAAGNCVAPSSNESISRTSYYNNPTYDDYPVIYVSWQDATNYCVWAGKRLPSEAEWEKAARGTNVITYPWGDASPTCSLANHSFYNGSSYTNCVGDTSEVGSYPDGASPYGVMDMAGNVWEWVNDWYSSSYYSTSPASNPLGPASGSYKVLRGGGWGTTIYLLRVSSRSSDNPTIRDSHVYGFRCAASPGN
jgi:formylglycine-generating enzyme required for sulfatase activity